MPDRGRSGCRRRLCRDRESLRPKYQRPARRSPFDGNRRRYAPRPRLPGRSRARTRRPDTNRSLKNASATGRSKARPVTRRDRAARLSKPTAKSGPRATSRSLLPSRREARGLASRISGWNHHYAPEPAILPEPFAQQVLHGRRVIEGRLVGERRQAVAQVFRPFSPKERIAGAAPR